MAFRIQRAKRIISGQAPGVRADIDVRTGGQQIAQVVAGIGGAMADLGLKWDIVQATTQLSESRRLAAERFSRLKIELSTLNNTDLYESKRAEAMTDIAKLVPKNARGARKYKEYVNSIAPGITDFVTGAVRAKRKDNFMAELFETKIRAEATGITSPFEVMLAEGRFFNFISKE